MPIETKLRKVNTFPPYALFKPPRVPLRDLSLISMSLEEYEAIRLVDIENKGQRKAAKVMEISQPTFNRILKSARRKIAQMLVLGQALVIEGGVNTLPCIIFRCTSCSFQWTTYKSDYPESCNKCNSTQIIKIA